MAAVKASLLAPGQAHDAKKGVTIIIKGFPCKVADVKTSKTGKHGHAKCNITGISVINGKKYTDIKPAHAATWIVNTNKQELTLSYIDGNDVNCLDQDMQEKVVVCEPGNSPEQEQNTKMLEEIQALEEELGDDEEIVLTVIEAPILQNEKNEVTVEFIDSVKKQKMA